MLQSSVTANAGAGRGGRRIVPAEGLAARPPRPATASWWSSSASAISSSGRRTAREVGAREQSEVARGAAPRGAGREHGVPRRPQPLLEVAQGADRVRARRAHAPEEGLGLSDGRAPAGGSPAVDPAVPPAPPAGRGRRLRPGDLRQRETCSRASARGSLGGKARGLAFVNLLLDEYEVARRLPRRPHRRAADRRRRHGRVRRSSSTTTACATSPSGAKTTRRSSKRFLRGRPPLGIVADLQSYLDLDPLPACHPLVQPARGLAVPAVRGHLLDLHAAEQPPGRRGPPRAVADGDQARLRLHLLPAREAVPGHHAVPPGGGEDGGDHPEGRRVAARAALLPEFRGRRAVAQLLPGEADDVDRRGGRRRPRPRRQRRGRRAVPAVLPALSPAPAAVLVREGRPQELAARFLRAAARRRRSGGGRAGRGRAGALRPRGRRAGRDAARGGVCVLARERRDLRRSFTGRREARQLCAHPQARSFPAGRDPGADARHR